MPGYVRADADRPSYRTVANRRVRDIAFLAWLRVASAEELDRMLWTTKHLPQWKRVAIARAVARQGSR